MHGTAVVDGCAKKWNTINYKRVTKNNLNDFND